MPLSSGVQSCNRESTLDSNPTPNHCRLRDQCTSPSLGPWLDRESGSKGRIGHRRDRACLDSDRDRYKCHSPISRNPSNLSTAQSNVHERVVLLLILVELSHVCQRGLDWAVRLGLGRGLFVRWLV